MQSEARDAVDIALAVAEALDAVGVGYFLGGSLASSLQGEPRATNAIDMVVALDEPQIALLAIALGPDFEVDEHSLREAARTRGSWNIFYLPLLTKIDLFILRDGAFDRSEYARRERVAVRADGASLFVKSAEDSILRKLRWFVDGGSVSDRQFRDVVAILRVSGPRLDVSYLDTWAGSLGVAADLARARQQVSAG